jgi:N-acetylglucosaminyldiphosphoundecaprenol N-acetyl-beta-D-mannosaminyltransferase
VTSGVSSCRIFGIDCYVGNVEDAAAVICDLAGRGQGGYAALMNVHVAMTAQRERDVEDALQRACAVFPDGAPIAWLQRRKGHDGGRRVGGPDLMLAALRAGGTKLRHFFFGSTPEVVSKLTDRLAVAVPGLNVAGAVAPAPGTENAHSTLDAVRRARPDIIWVALGAPKQELWARRHAASVAPALVVPVGAAFDFHAGTKQRAPQWMQRVGFEWLHRVMHEPGRLGGRYVRTNGRFVFSAVRELRGDMDSPNHA